MGNHDLHRSSQHVGQKFAMNQPRLDMLHEERCQMMLYTHVFKFVIYKKWIVFFLPDTGLKCPARKIQLDPDFLPLSYSYYSQFNKNNTCLTIIFYDSPRKPVPDYHHSGFYWTKHDCHDHDDIVVCIEASIRLIFQAQPALLNSENSMHELNDILGYNLKVFFYQ